ncbi:glycoside hydrolase [Sarocladium strictum]
MLPFTAILAASGAVCAPEPRAAYLDWSKFKANGVNLGGWLHQEQVIDPVWWNQNGGTGLLDEWDWCANLGEQCGPRLEQRYASYITTKDIDKMASVGINVLRIPTGYNAWVRVPGSRLYTGNQVRFLRSLSNYAIRKYNMHVIVDIHSHPGGVNGMGLGGREGGFGWFNNQTALEYSFKAVDEAIKFIQDSDHPHKFTLQPLNEPVDNPASFGFPDALTPEGVDWVLSYFRGILSRVQKVNPKIPVMLQGAFRPESFWSQYFAASDNIVFDEHHYYFAGRPTTSVNLPEFICSDAQGSTGDGKFPVFVGEWSIQAVENNTFASRPLNLNTGLKAWAQYTQGSAYWTWKFRGNDPVDGQGTQGDYWNYEFFVDSKVIDPSSGRACA